MICRLDEKTRYFKIGLDEMSLKLRERYYSSVSEFSAELSAIISKRILDNATDKDASGDIEAISTHLNEVKPGTAEHSALTQEQKEIKRLAKRILKAVKEPLEDAVRKEAELKGLERDELMKKVDALPLFAAGKALDLDTEPSPVKKSGKHRRSASEVSAVPGASPDNEDEEMPDADVEVNAKEEVQPRRTGKKSTPTSEATTSRASSRHSKSASLSKPVQVTAATEPISPPTSAAGTTESSSSADVDMADLGGVPWYLEHFDPVGTTVHEERYSGREVLRGLSEELSDMDEDTLSELKVSGSFVNVEGPRRSTRGQVAAALEMSALEAGEGERKRPKKKGLRSRWSKGRVR